MLRFVTESSGPGSSILMSYLLQSVLDGTCQAEGADRIRRVFSQGGELLRLGIEEGTVDRFLSERGFCQVKDISGDLYETEYFKGPNRGRKVCFLCHVVYATVESTRNGPRVPD